MHSLLKSPSLPAFMHGIQIHAGRLHYTTLPLPVAQPDDVVIRVAYAGVNHADLLQRDGKYAPPEGASELPGLEVSGWVAAGNQTWQIGTPVCALLSGGGYAEYVAVPASQVLPIPEGCSLAQAACLPEAAATAVMALELEAQLMPRERLLVHGGTSGLGLIMTQIGKDWGAEVMATVGSDEKVAWLKAFGITALNHRSSPYELQVMQHTNNEGVDVIIDTLGGAHLATHLKLLRRNGRLVSLAMLDGPNVTPFKMTRLLTHHLRWSGTTLRSRNGAEKAQIMGRVGSRVWPAIAAQQIQPAIAQVFPLPEAEKALATMQERLHLGKILLEVASK